MSFGLSVTDWLEHHLLPCPYKSLLGIDCPGCGMQRAFVALLRGRVLDSLMLYPALLPVLFTLGLTVVHLKFRLRQGAAYIKYSYILTVSIVVVSYILKLAYQSS